MHHAGVLRGIGQAGQLCDRQGVNVCPQRHRRPVFSDRRYQPMPADPGDDGQTDFGQPPGQKGGGLLFGAGQFRMAVQVVTHLDQPFQVL